MKKQLAKPSPGKKKIARFDDQPPSRYILIENYRENAEARKFNEQELFRYPGLPGTY